LIVYEEFPVKVSSYLVAAAIWADPENTPVPVKTAEPDAKCPPLATTTLPEVDESKAISTL